MGVPIVGCNCSVCRSDDPRDNRLRTSAMIEIGDVHLLIDTSSDFRQQMLRSGRQRLNAVLYTHHHVDHILGLDDLRSLNFFQHRPIPIYANRVTMENLRRVFTYVFNGQPSVSDIPRLEPHIIGNEPFEVDGVAVTPIPLLHGDLPILGYRIGNFAYCTDCSAIPQASLELLKGLKILILDALRFRTHPTHFSLEEARETAQKIAAERTYFIHLTHDVPHRQTDAQLPDGIFLAYDGLKLEIDAR